MLLDNTLDIKRFIRWHLGNNEDNRFFFKFEALIRAKDNPNNLCMAGHSGSFLVHSWVITSVDNYDKYLPEMKAICDVTGARLYMSLDMKDTHDLANSVFDYATSLLKQLANRNQLSAKNIFNSVNSLTSKKDCSVHEHRQWLVDIDGSFNLLKCTYSKIRDNIVKSGASEPDLLTILKSPNGWHILVPRVMSKEVLPDEEEGFITVKENAMTIVYFNRKES